jgi:molybdenum cofactor guanylyltransferase
VENKPVRRSVGVILAGGQARRLGGVDKGLVEIGGESILSRLIRRLAPQCDALALNANGELARFAFLGLPVVADSAAGFLGPLAGVLAGLDHAAATNDGEDCDVLSVPADTPFVPRNLMARLRQAREQFGARIAVASSGGRAHHAIALWPAALRADLRHALMEQDLRKVSAFIRRYETCLVEWPTTPFDPFFNVNTPQDIGIAETIASMDDPSGG